MNNSKICRRCDEPVTVNAESYDVFEGMHWLCFHLEFEHQADPDEPCGDPGCPWWHIAVLKEKLSQLGCDPKLAIKEAIAKRWKL
jgi:hypothetical protein